MALSFYGVTAVVATVADASVVGEGASSAPRWPVVAAGAGAVCWLQSLIGLAVAAVSDVAGRISWPDFSIGLAYPAVAVLVSRVRAPTRWAA